MALAEPNLARTQDPLGRVNQIGMNGDVIEARMVPREEYFAGECRCGGRWLGIGRKAGRNE